MSAGCGLARASAGEGAPALAAYRRVLWTVLITNGVMFVVEGTSGLAADSVSLQADALDFLGDAATYGISLMVLGLSLRWRAAAALLKGAAMAAFGLWVLGASLYHAVNPALPVAAVMGSIGALALVANVVSAVLLYRFRHGDANVRSVWLCTRNDAIGNIAVMAAGGAVFVTATRWPDLGVGAMIAALALSSAFIILRQATREMRGRAEPLEHTRAEPFGHTNVTPAE